jgi:anaerobic selenocysteine-containing dehydrogenase
VKVLIALGGNLAAAAPDTERTARALRNCDLTVHISTKLNRSHLVTGKDALILPTLGRTELDMQASGSQYITVEDSFSMVHASEGIGKPLAETQRSETAIVCGIADAVLGTQQLDWLELADDYSLIRDHIAATIPGFEDFNRRCDQPGGFYLGNAAAELRFATPSGKAGVQRRRAADHPVPTAGQARKRRSPCKRCARTISTTPPSMVWMTATAAFTVSVKCCSSIRRIWRRWACRTANG